MIEARIITDENEEAYRELITEVFSYPKGKQLLAALVNAQHPMNHNVTSDSRKDAFNAGEKSVISFLCRYSGVDGAIEINEPTQKSE